MVDDSKIFKVIRCNTVLPFSMGQHLEILQVCIWCQTLGVDVRAIIGTLEAHHCSIKAGCLPCCALHVYFMTVAVTDHDRPVNGGPSTFIAENKCKCACPASQPAQLLI